MDDERIQPLAIVDALRDQIAMAFQKNSEFTSLFNYHIISLKEKGILSNIQKKWLPANVLFGSNDNQLLDAMELDYENLVLPFTFCVIGILMSMLILLFEIIYRKMLLVHNK